MLSFGCNKDICYLKAFSPKQGVQRLLDDEFPGIKHIRTSTLHKKISNAHHGFIKLSGTENKLESLLQVEATLNFLLLL